MMDGFVDRWESMHNRIGQPNMCSKPAMIFCDCFPAGRPGGSAFDGPIVEWLSSYASYNPNETSPPPPPGRPKTSITLNITTQHSIPASSFDPAPEINNPRTQTIQSLNPRCENPNMLKSKTLYTSSEWKLQDVHLDLSSARLINFSR